MDVEKAVKAMEDNLAKAKSQITALAEQAIERAGQLHTSTGHDVGGINIMVHISTARELNRERERTVRAASGAICGVVKAEADQAANDFIDDWNSGQRQWQFLVAHVDHVGALCAASQPASYMIRSICEEAFKSGYHLGRQLEERHAANPAGLVSDMAEISVTVLSEVGPYYEAELERTTRITSAVISGVIGAAVEQCRDDFSGQHDRGLEGWMMALTIKAISTEYIELQSAGNIVTAAVKLAYDTGLAIGWETLRRTAGR